MKVLVSAASRHGATAEIARTIGDTLEEAGLEAAVLPPDAVTTLDGYGAAVLGSGIYLGRWMDTAKHLVERHADGLAVLPVWLFSSGPIGEAPRTDEDPADLPEIMEADPRAGAPALRGEGRQGRARPGREGHPHGRPVARRRLPTLGGRPGMGSRDRRCARGEAVR